MNRLMDEGINGLTDRWSRRLLQPVSSEEFEAMQLVRRFARFIQQIHRFALGRIRTDYPGLTRIEDGFRHCRSSIPSQTEIEIRLLLSVQIHRHGFNCGSTSIKQRLTRIIRSENVRSEGIALSPTQTHTETQRNRHG